jgi:hypothetical protein
MTTIVMLSPLGVCNNFAGIDEREYMMCYSGRRHADVNVFWRLRQALDVNLKNI